MAIEVASHPAAKDHTGSVMGLAFCVFILFALIFCTAPAIYIGAVLTNVIIGVVGVYLILRYLNSPGIAWSAAPETIARTYFVVVVPAFAVRYFVNALRAASGSPGMTPNNRIERTLVR